MLRSSSITDALRQLEIEKFSHQVHRLVDEDAAIHGHGFIDDGLEIHVGENVLFDVDTGATSISSSPPGVN